jgi:hypothetical protein
VKDVVVTETNHYPDTPNYIYGRFDDGSGNHKYKYESGTEGNPYVSGSANVYYTCTPGSDTNCDSRQMPNNEDNNPTFAG